MNPLSKILRAGRVAANQAWKAGRHAFRNPVQGRYEAGRRWQYGERSYLWSFVTDARFDADQATRIELVRKARFFEANSPLVQRLADVWEQYIVGSNGLILSPDSEDEQWNDAAAQWFDEWSNFPDLVSLQNWATLQSLIARTWFIDGEVFILKTRSERPPYRPRIQLIEGHRVGTPGNMTQLEGRSIVDGIEVDKKGRPTAYYVQDGFDVEDYRRIDSSEIIHIGEPARVGMYRPLTHFYAVMNPLHDLDDLERLEMEAARDQASTSKVIKTPTGELPDDANSWETQTDPNPNGGTNPLTQYYKRVFGASTKVMKIGDEVEYIQPNRPSVVQQWYWKYLTEKVCTGVGIPLVLVFPESLQGTVYRGALDSANAFFRSRSAVLAAKFEEVWRYVIGTGALQDVRIADRPARWFQLTCRPPRAVNVDVGRNSAAMLAELAAGTRTWQDICGETGEDWKAKLTQRAKEAAFIHELATKFKITPQEITDVTAIPPVTPPDVAPVEKATTAR